VRGTELARGDWCRLALPILKRRRGEGPCDDLGVSTLLVGKNPSGKTWALHVIGNLGELFAKDIEVRDSGHGDVSWEDSGQSMRYDLESENGEVMNEQFLVRDQPKLDRWRNGEEEIVSERSVDETKKPS